MFLAAFWDGWTESLHSWINVQVAGTNCVITLKFLSALEVATTMRYTNQVNQRLLYFTSSPLCAPPSVRALSKSTIQTNDNDNDET